MDFLSCSCYPKATEHSSDRSTFRDAPDVSLEEMLRALNPQRQFVQELCNRSGNKPILFSEFGTRSAHGCCACPWDYLADTGYDGEEQANYMEAIFRTFDDLPQWLGFTGGNGMRLSTDRSAMGTLAETGALPFRENPQKKFCGNGIKNKSVHRCT